MIIPRNKLYSLGMTYVTRRNPWTAVWWSVALPGFGQLYLGQHLMGLVLMSWEIIVNHMAGLNLAIYHTLMGRPDLATEVVDPEWLIMYPLFYVYSMFDAYRSCLAINQVARLERLQRRRKFERYSGSNVGATMLWRRNPIMSALWSAALPGFGQLYNDRGVKAVVLIGWYFAVALLSGLAPAAYHTILGEFDEALRHLNYQWLLFWPSIYLFGIADAYADSVEQNRICDEAFCWRMRKYLRNGLR